MQKIINIRKVFARSLDISLDEDVFISSNINFSNLEFVENLIIRKTHLSKEFSGWEFVTFAEFFPNLKSLELHLGKITSSVKSPLFFELLPQIQNLQVKKVVSKLMSISETFPITVFFTDAIQVFFEDGDEWSFCDHISSIQKSCQDFHFEMLTLEGISIANFKKSISSSNKILNYEFKFVNFHSKEDENNS